MVAGMGKLEEHSYCEAHPHRRAVAFDDDGVGACVECVAPVRHVAPIDVISETIVSLTAQLAEANRRADAAGSAWAASQAKLAEVVRVDQELLGNCEAALAELRAERDDARELLAEVLASTHGLHLLPRHVFERASVHVAAWKAARAEKSK